MEENRAAAPPELSHPPPNDSPPLSASSARAGTAPPPLTGEEMSGSGSLIKGTDDSASPGGNRPAPPVRQLSLSSGRWGQYVDGGDDDDDADRVGDHDGERLGAAEYGGGDDDNRHGDESSHSSSGDGHSDDDDRSLPRPDSHENFHGGSVYDNPFDFSGGSSGSDSSDYTDDSSRSDDDEEDAPAPHEEMHGESVYGAMYRNVVDGSNSVALSCDDSFVSRSEEGSLSRTGPGDWLDGSANSRPGDEHWCDVESQADAAAAAQQGLGPIDENASGKCALSEIDMREAAMLLRRSSISTSPSGGGLTAEDASLSWKSRQSLASSHSSSSRRSSRRNVANSPPAGSEEASSSWKSRQSLASSHSSSSQRGSRRSLKRGRSKRGSRRGSKRAGPSREGSSTMSLDAGLVAAAATDLGVSPLTEKETLANRRSTSLRSSLSSSFKSSLGPLMIAGAGGAAAAAAEHSPPPSTASANEAAAAEAEAELPPSATATTPRASSKRRRSEQRGGDRDGSITSKSGSITSKSSSLSKRSNYIGNLVMNDDDDDGVSAVDNGAVESSTPLAEAASDAGGVAAAGPAAAAAASTASAEPERGEDSAAAGSGNVVASMSGAATGCGAASSSPPASHRSDDPLDENDRGREDDESRAVGAAAVVAGAAAATAAIATGAAVAVSSPAEAEASAAPMEAAAPANVEAAALTSAASPAADIEAAPAEASPAANVEASPAAATSPAEVEATPVEVAPANGTREAAEDKSDGDLDFTDIEDSNDDAAVAAAAEALRAPSAPEAEVDAKDDDDDSSIIFMASAEKAAAASSRLAAAAALLPSIEYEPRTFSVPSATLVVRNVACPASNSNSSSSAGSRAAATVGVGLDTNARYVFSRELARHVEEYFETKPGICDTVHDVSVCVDVLKVDAEEACSKNGRRANSVVGDEPAASAETTSASTNTDEARLVEGRVLKDVEDASDTAAAANCGVRARSVGGGTAVFKDVVVTYSQSTSYGTPHGHAPAPRGFVLGPFHTPELLAAFSERLRAVPSGQTAALREASVTTAPTIGDAGCIIEKAAAGRAGLVTMTSARRPRATIRESMDLACHSSTAGSANWDLEEGGGGADDELAVSHKYPDKRIDEDEKDILHSVGCCAPKLCVPHWSRPLLMVLVMVAMFVGVFVPLSKSSGGESSSPSGQESSNIDDPPPPTNAAEKYPGIDDTGFGLEGYSTAADAAGAASTAADNIFGPAPLDAAPWDGGSDADKGEGEEERDGVEASQGAMEERINDNEADSALDAEGDEGGTANTIEGEGSPTDSPEGQLRKDDVFAHPEQPHAATTEADGASHEDGALHPGRAHNKT